MTQEADKRTLRGAAEVEFKSFIAQWQASHVMTSPYYPHSNGKFERFHQTLKDQSTLRNPVATMKQSWRRFLTAKPHFFRYWAWRLQTAATFTATLFLKMLYSGIQVEPRALRRDGS